MEMRPTTIAALGETQWVPLQIYNRTKQFAGSFSNTRGAHNLRVGAGLVMRSFGVLQSNSAQGLWGFDSTADQQRGHGRSEATPFASFLLGYPTDVRRLYTPSMPHYHTNEPSVFFQDDWRAKSWLTVNLGLRYDVFTPLTEEDNHLSNFVPSLGKLLVAGENGVGRTAGVNTDYSDIGPRFGFSASLPSQMVLRGGYGLAYYPNNKNAGRVHEEPAVYRELRPEHEHWPRRAACRISSSRTGLPAVVFANPDQPTGNVIGTDIELQVRSRAAVQPDARERVLGQRRHGRVRGLARRSAAARGGDELQPGAGRRRAECNQRRPYFSAVPADGQREHPVERRQVDLQRLAVRLQPPLPRRPDATSHYTWAHSRQYTPVPWDFSQFEWGDTQQFDVRHRFVATASYELPLGKSLTGVAHGFLAAWQVNATAYLQSGVAYTVVNAASRTNTGNNAGTLNGGDRPNVNGDPNLPSSERTVQRWFDTSVFSAAPTTLRRATSGCR